MSTLNDEYTRKIIVAGDTMNRAWLRGGLDAMHSEQASWRRMDADPIILAEMLRLYHVQCKRVLPVQTLTDP